MSVARPLLRALLRAESAWRRAAREAMQRSSAAAASSSSSSLSTSSSSSSSLEPGQGASTTRSSAPDDDRDTLLRFREPMDTSAWQRGRHGWALGGESYHLEAARAALGPGGGGNLPLGPPSSGTFRGTQLRRLILSNFRAAEAAFKQHGLSDLSAAEDAGFAALRALGEQRAMERCSSDSVCANGVRVEATAALVAALPCSSSSSRAFLSGSSSGSMRSVTSAGPGVIVITSVQEGTSSDEDEDEDEDEEGEGEDSDDGDDSRVRHAASSSSSSSSPSLSSSSAPEMRYVFTYRLRITNTNPPLPEEEEDEEEGEESGEEAEEEKGEAASAASAALATETETGGGVTPGLRVQLLTRGWQIRDSSGRLHAAVPKGSPGVVGCTPVLVSFFDVFFSFSGVIDTGGKN